MKYDDIQVYPLNNGLHDYITALFQWNTPAIYGKLWKTSYKSLA